MINPRLVKSIKRLHRRLNGSTIETNLKRYEAILYKIKACQTVWQTKTDRQLQEAAQILNQSAEKSGNLDNLLIETYALVSEVIKRVLSIKPFDVQIIGGIVLHQGKVAEMQTGEGKTLTAVFPATLNALSGQGVHVLTFNDYLARRDAEWMGPVYHFLGVTVGHIREGLGPDERRQAYLADITYLTAKEAGFDFLRDSFCTVSAKRVQRPFHMAIIDEADSILIDEARIPLVLAGASDDAIPSIVQFARIVRTLEYGRDVEMDEAGRNVSFTEAGLEKVEKLLKSGNLYTDKNLEVLTQLNCALHAQFLLKRDVDYLVRHNRIELLDEFTGRIADLRRWPNGLQAALEAKENIPLQIQGRILNSITLQHFLQLYPKMCGMTATAESAEDELRRFYNLNIVVIPPNKPSIRIDSPDLIFRTKAQKETALIREILKVQKTKGPILVGTRSVQESALLAANLKEKGVRCNVLNAKNDEFEAQIISEAGKLGAVTISTNMAGRGTDIRLGGMKEKEKAEVVALGGLYVIGTNKHESQRIDTQLRGRAGRQGDPGCSCFFISLEDDLCLKYNLKDFISNKWLEGDQEGRLDHPGVRNEINRLQRIIEGQNLEIKKTLFKYSALIEQQRRIMFAKREEVLNPTFSMGESFGSEEFNPSLIFFKDLAPEKFQEYRSIIGFESLHHLCQKILAGVIDSSWSQYLADIEGFREGIHLFRIGGKDPYIEFQKLAVARFSDLQKEIEDQAIQIFTNMRISGKNLQLEGQVLKTPSATWTYLINDDPMEHPANIEMLGPVGLSFGTVLMWPLWALIRLFQKLEKKGRQEKGRERS